jgi:hypothetical protein
MDHGLALTHKFDLTLIRTHHWHICAHSLEYPGYGLCFANSTTCDLSTDTHRPILRILMLADAEERGGEVPDNRESIWPSRPVVALAPTAGSGKRAEITIHRDYDVLALLRSSLPHVAI